VLGDGLLGKLALKANLALIGVSRSLFSYQIYVEAESTPDVSFVLEDSRRRSEPAPPSPEDRVNSVARGSRFDN
jgi:hypothetical protein